MKGLYPKILLLVGSVFTAIMVVILVFVSISANRQMEQEWLARAETLNRMAFEAMYASLTLGGRHEDNQEIIARLEEMGAFSNARVVQGDPSSQQFGSKLGGAYLDELEQRAFAGEEVGVILRADGYRVVKYVTPLRIEARCQECHPAEVGAINGIISTEISLRDYEIAQRKSRDVLLLVLGSGVLALGVLTFFALRRLVLQPLQAIQQGIKTIAQGNLDHRLHVRTGDELEAFAQEFNQMVQQLQASYGQIAEEQNRILTALEASRDAMWISGADRRVVIVNSAMERLLGRSREQLIGQMCQHLLCLHTVAGASICEGACSFLQSDAQSGQIEGYITAASGQEIWVEVSYGRVTDPRGSLTGGVHIVHDLTQRKEIEQLKDEFISMVSHELRTPLHHIKGFATTLLQTDVEWDEVAQRDFLDSINRESDRLTDLVEKILHLSRLETEGLPMQKEWWQVDDLIDGALTRRHSLLADREVRLDLASNLPPLFVDGHEIEVVLMNLIENAIKYSYPETPITVVTKREAGQVVFSVTDLGPGIAQEHLERIFERFYRVDSEKRRASGTGLGLAICKRIVESHHGTIGVSSTPDVGSRFHFSLPLDGAEYPINRSEHV